MKLLLCVEINGDDETMGAWRSWKLRCHRLWLGPYRSLHFLWRWRFDCRFYTSHSLDSAGVIFFAGLTWFWPLCPLFLWCNRRKVPPRLVRRTTSHTLCADDVERFPTTSGRRYAHPADTLLLRCVISTGLSRPRPTAQLALAVCATWRRWHVDSRMVSEKVHKQRSRLPARKQ